MPNVRVDGLPELLRVLEHVGGKEFAEETVKPALLRGAEEMRREAIMRAPVRTGALRRSLIARLSDRPNLVRAYMAVDFDLIEARDSEGRKSRYPYMVEKGVRPHKITAQPGEFLRFGGHFARSVNHPGFAGTKYFQRAVNAKRRSVPLQIVREIGAVLDRELSVGRIAPL